MNSQDSEQKKTKHPILKKIAIFFLLIFIILYLFSLVGTYSMQKTIKNLSLTSNEALTKQDVTIDYVEFNLPFGTINRLKVFNPDNYVSPYAVSIGKIEMTGGFSANRKMQNMIVEAAYLKDIIINYDINANNSDNSIKVNLYQIIENIRSNKTENNANQQIKFYINKITVYNPTINIYKNRNLIKTIAIDNINIDTSKVEQPISYKDLLLEASIQVIDKVDKAIRN